MKNILFFSLILLSAITHAQPMLTGAANNPVAGDNFTFYLCSTAGIVQGAAGAAVTWDFHTLTPTDTAFFNFINCTGTSSCDSFAGSNIGAEVHVGSTTNFEYFVANSSVFESLGSYAPGFGYEYYDKPERLHIYPVVYGSSVVDTYVSHASGAISYTIIRDSTFVDGYGTLILPSGTFTNVLRKHTKSVEFDSTLGIVTYYGSTYESYDWFMPGYHDILLEVRLDSSGSGLQISSVLYTTGGSATGVATISNHELSPEVSPNPASDILHIKFASERQGNMIITLSDITGKTVINIPAEMSAGANDIQCPVADLPAGLYLLRLANGTYNITKKVVVTH